MCIRGGGGVPDSLQVLALNTDTIALTLSHPMTSWSPISLWVFIWGFNTWRYTIVHGSCLFKLFLMGGKELTLLVCVKEGDTRLQDNGIVACSVGVELVYPLPNPSCADSFIQEVGVHQVDQGGVQGDDGEWSAQTRRRDCPVPAGSWSSGSLEEEANCVKGSIELSSVRV